jgi:hypothetical protein
VAELEGRWAEQGRMADGSLSAAEISAYKTWA